MFVLPCRQCQQDVYYPLIDIDPKSIILPSVINISTDKIFIERECSVYMKAFSKWRSKGSYSALQILSDIPYRQGQDPLVNSIVKNVAFYLLLFWNMIISMYTYFHQYSQVRFSCYKHRINYFQTFI
jgi:hypothetical protein